MEKEEIEFKKIQLASDFKLCMEAREDAYFCSFQTCDGFKQFISGYKRFIYKSIHDEQWFYLHVWQNNQIVGQLEFCSHSHEPSTGYIQLIYLFPAYRGKGIAQKIHQFICSSLIAAGCKKAMLTVSRSNHRAISYYARHGWTYVKANPKFENTDFYQLTL